MEPNKQRMVRIQVDDILKTFNLTGSSGTGMSSGLLQKIDALAETWTSSTPLQMMTSVDPASKSNKSLLAQASRSVAIDLERR